MNEIKKEELDRVTFKTDSLRKYFPKSYTNKQMEDKIIQLLEQWQKKEKNQWKGKVKMFTPKNIQGALEELYDLCDPDYMVDMLVNYSEEFDDISPALLAKSFQKNAEMISEYQYCPLLVRVSTIRKGTSEQQSRAASVLCRRYERR